MTREKIIHDPVHGSIRLSGLVLDLVDTLEVQRLRRIHQLGFANLVFPGANHARFEHSLGVAYLVQRVSHELGLPPQEKDLLISAAMLHDIGHPPYSHTLECLMLEHIGMNHMELAGEVLKGKLKMCAPEETEKLTKLGVPSAAEVLSDHGLDPEELSHLLLGEHEKPYLSQIIHSDVDVDQMDYLLRDSHFTGVALGKIDIDRLLRTLRVHQNRLAIANKGVEAVEGLLTARALMHSSVYFHHTTRTAELMLANAVDRAIAEGGPVTKENFYKMGDEELMERLYETGGYPRDIVVRLRYRQLFKPALVITREELELGVGEKIKRVCKEWLKLRELQDEIAEAAGVPRGEVILDAPMTDIAITEPRLKKVEVPVLADGKLVRLSKVSPLPIPLKERQATRYVMRVLAPVEHLNRVAEPAKEILS
ncbi:MAG: HD domain-containing protein [Hadesarchaea archaeon]|nr:HD domain-containing protein [Hadesarchaea archaeon]